MKYHEKRLDICKKCEHFRSWSNQCGKCGCFMNIKTRFRSLECPEGKWKKVRSNKQEREMIAFVQGLGARITAEEQEKFWKIYNETFEADLKPSCRSCLFDAVKRLQNQLQ